ncbi:MAG: Gfo/Idh/MocA family oxidoreductase [Candidatus Lambdaproteobacteria bacterium]|nr:Gfo/Idh/MocA family oxidoreductase [Candidatus Lambdaproteobacteria bacterium]
MADPVKAAVVGVGYLGRFHAQKYASLQNCKLVAVVDIDPARAEAVGRELGVPGTTDLEAVLPQVEAVSIAAATAAHFELGRRCLAAGKHALIEKPLTATTEQAEALVDLAEARGVLLQVGHLERYNPALLGVRGQIARPQFIEAIRISSFLGRGADVDVVLDLMSHDLDLVLHLVGSPLVHLHAVGISLVTSSTDLANARLVFQNGAVANLTASRISTKAERTMRIFQADAYFSLDFAAPAARVYRRTLQAEAAGGFAETVLTPPKGDALLSEIDAFAACIRGAAPSGAGGRDGLRTVAVAQQVIQDISRNRLP